MNRLYKIKCLTICTRKCKYIPIHILCHYGMKNRYSSSFNYPVFQGVGFTAESPYNSYKWYMEIKWKCVIRSFKSTGWKPFLALEVYLFFMYIILFFNI